MHCMVLMPDCSNICAPNYNQEVVTTGKSASSVRFPYAVSRRTAEKLLP
jgi:hypothetical protein